MVISLSVPALLGAQEPEAEPSDPASATVEATVSEEEQPAAEAGDEGAPASLTATRAAVKAAASVEMRDFEFSPRTVTIDPGDSVTWTNVGDEDHDADGGSFSTGTISPGGHAAVRFDDPGTFSYICNFHSNMKGTVVVNSAGRGGPGDGGTGDGGTTGPTGGSPSSNDPGAFGSGSTTSSSGAGSSGSLPNTGQNEIPLIVVGAGFLVCGLLVGALWRHQTGP